MLKCSCGEGLLYALSPPHSPNQFKHCYSQWPWLVLLEYYLRILHGNTIWEYYMGILHGNTTWEYYMGILYEAHVVKKFTASRSGKWELFSGKKTGVLTNSWCRHGWIWWSRPVSRTPWKRVEINGDLLIYPCVLQLTAGAWPTKRSSSRGAWGTSGTRRASWTP